MPSLWREVCSLMQMTMPTFIEGTPFQARIITYIRVDLDEALDDFDASANVRLHPDDKIVIGSRRILEDDHFIDVQGAVRSPGRYRYGGQMSLGDAIRLANGFTFSAASNRIDIFRVEVKDNEPTKTVVATAELDRDLNILKGQEIELFPFDQIVVREVPEFEFQKIVYVGGEVKYPGPYALSTSNERLTSIIERSGGTDRGGI